jgi:hypothetical protein
MTSTTDGTLSLNLADLAAKPIRPQVGILSSPPVFPLPRDVRHWSLTTLREKLVKIGAKVTRHAKYVTFQLAEVAVPRRLFAAILDRIARLAIPPPTVCECVN